MTPKPCEADLYSEDHETWGKAVSKCSSGAPWECIEKNECVNDGVCFTNPWSDPDKALAKISELEAEICTLKVRETLLITRLQSNLTIITDKYRAALKTGNQPMVWATDFVKREINEIIKGFDIV
ncbi:TPA: hypothetical protein NM870_003620 [Acinetobacter baumannii]|nr:hypothetical protein [Acinetobacter baumannii]